MKKLENKKGITLIALVITIIVLLILAGVSIATLTGENGILNQATKSRNMTEEAKLKENISMAVFTARIDDNGYNELNQNNLQNSIDSTFGLGNAIVIGNEDGTYTIHFKNSKIDYNVTSNSIEKGIDWNKAMQNAKSPEDQNETRNDNAIAIGTDGNPVNLDLWEYTQLEDGTYILNDHDSIDATGTNGTAGYKGKFIDGKIIGTVPTYISIDNGKSFNEVTSMKYTFTGCNEECLDLKIAPKIPHTVNFLDETFFYTKNLEIAPFTIPNSVISIDFCFCGTDITNAPYLGNSIKNMEGAFRLSKLVEAPEIPNSVTTLRLTFSECNLLVKPPQVIPESVESLYQTFIGDEKLSGHIEINARIKERSDLFQCFGGAATDDDAKITLTGSYDHLEYFLYNGSHIIILKD